MGRIYLTAEVSEKTGAISLKNEKPVSREYFLQFIAANPELRTELTAEGEMIVMPPAYSLSGHQNADLVTQLSYWAKKDGSGQSFDCRPRGRVTDVKKLFPPSPQQLTPPHRRTPIPDMLP